MNANAGGVIRRADEFDAGGFEAIFNAGKVVFSSVGHARNRFISLNST